MASVRRLSIVSDAELAQGAAELHALGDDEGSGLLQVGQLAKIVGKTVRAIHLYEDLGLLKPAERSKGRFRLYEKDAIERVRWISKLQGAGFSLPELREILRAHETTATAKEAARRLADAYQAKLREVENKLRDLRRIERELGASLAFLEACESACEEHVPSGSCPSCDRHRDRLIPPALVVGAFAQ